MLGFPVQYVSAEPSFSKEAELVSTYFCRWVQKYWVSGLSLRTDIGEQSQRSSPALPSHPPPPFPSPTPPSKRLSLLAGLMLQRTDQIFLSKSCCSLHDVRCSTLAMQTDAMPVNVLPRGMRHDPVSDTKLSFLISRCPVRSCPVSTSCPALPCPALPSPAFPSQSPALPTPALFYPFLPCLIHFCLPSRLALSCLSHVCLPV